MVITRRKKNDPLFPICPICGKECETIYRDTDYQILGCDKCVQEREAWEIPDCFPESE